LLIFFNKRYRQAGPHRLQVHCRRQANQTTADYNYTIVSRTGWVYSRPMRADPSNNDRAYDIVVVGASGFTGRLVVEYLAENYPVGAPIRWAIAGRNREKLESVLAEYCTAGELPSVIVADSHDSNALAQLARDTRVVLTTVGPYAKYGILRSCRRDTVDPPDDR
jgi:hypothetical protein